MEMLSEQEIEDQVREYSVLVGFLMVLFFVVPCIMMAFLSKYCQKKTTTTGRRMSTQRRSSLGILEERCDGTLIPESDSSMCSTFGIKELQLNKLNCHEQILCLKYGLHCTQSWKADIPCDIFGSNEGFSDKKIIAVRKLVPPYDTSKDNHKSCLRMEMNAIGKGPQHPVLLNLIGVCRSNPTANPSALIYEYPLYGSLHSFLICKRRGMISNNTKLWNALTYEALESDIFQFVPERKPPSLSNLLDNYDTRSHPFKVPLKEELRELDILLFGLQIASGIEFLSTSGITHKLLSTENIIISCGFYLKLSGIVGSDLPLAHRNLGYNRQSQRTNAGRMMERWNAPEVMLSKEHTNQSQVWKYGMLMWEICSLGDTPFVHLPYRALVDSLKKGELPSLPEHCSTDLYSLMKTCWTYNPEARPQINEVIQEVLDLLQSHEVKETHSSQSYSVMDLLRNRRRSLQMITTFVNTIVSPNHYDETAV